MVKRIYVQKKSGFDVEAKGLLQDLKENLLMDNLQNIIILNRYDVEGISKKVFERAKNTVFSEPQVDICFEEEYPFEKSDKVFGIEYLPGQFDQRANSLSECLQILTEGTRPISKSAKIYILKGDLSSEDVNKIKSYIINPVDSRECTLEKLVSLEEKQNEPADVAIVEGFIKMTEEDSKKFYEKYGFAMDLSDLKFCQEYFRDTEKRDPTMTEMKMIDTYWSDHCRHTTFLSKLEKVEINWNLANNIFEEYKKSREYVYDGKKTKDICLMDVATIAVKELKKRGMLKDLDESEEINACSIKAEILVDGKPEEYLVMFKNETHNHPTEIEPFGGAATCLGGAIRDPLSGRVYVYQAMRVTGCGDPRISVQDTMPNKLPQRKLTNEAARGYSSYGNQIGLATGQVTEIYHPGYVAKRMEIGALVGAAPKENVVRSIPKAGDTVILLGGKTGRDGCGGATGSSKAHNSESLSSCGAEVQKGNAPEERKIQRLFRNSEVTKLIKRCNDFGAGGVSVAIGELADGLEINLDKVPKKYEGLDGTELAISESQERMAVVIDSKDIERFQELASSENIESTVVAKVTEEPRMKMYWRGKLIVDLSREFLNTNGTVKKAEAQINKPEGLGDYFNKFNKMEQPTFVENSCIKVNGKNCSKAKRWKSVISDLNCCSQKGLVERFDSTIGAGTVFMPFGGKYQLTPIEAMCAKIPTLNGYTNSGTIMSFGYDPYLSEISPLHGAVYAVIDSLTKYVACGGDYKKAWFTFQEYFEKLRNEPTRWGKPLAALLGAYLVQEKLGLASIGGKDSMSGSYNELDVPPTLVSFCIGVVDTNKVVSNEFKKAGSKVYMLKTKINEDYLPDFEDLKENYEIIHKLIGDKKALSIASIRQYGIADAISKMCFGNKIGFEFKIDKCVFKPRYGSFIIEAAEELNIDKLELLGTTIEEKEIRISKTEKIDLEELISLWEKPLEKVFPTKAESKFTKIENVLYKGNVGVDDYIDPKKISNSIPKLHIARPKVFIPVFPGTNCEYDLAKAFTDAGADPKITVFKNLKENDIEESIKEMEKAINESQIIMLPGGFSAGDEPDGSGKFIATVFRNPRLKEAIHKHLNEQDGLILRNM